MARTKIPERMSVTRSRAPAASQQNPETPVATEKTVKAPAIPTSKIPQHLRFPLIVLLNMSLSSLLYTISAEFTAGDLAHVSRSVNDWPQIFGLVACKILELGASWYSGFDGYDVASLTLLTHLPPLVLLTTCYSIRPTTLLSSLAIDLASTSLPFSALRRPSAPHTDNPPAGSIANRSIISDLPTQVLAALLGAGTYAFTLYGSYYTFLPRFLATHFSGLRSLRGVYEAQFLTLVLLFVPIGVAAKVFLFTPATAAKRDEADAKREGFDPATAGLGETFWWNVWGFSKRGRVMIARTACLAGVTFLYGWLQVYASVEGAESVGAAGWAGVWALAALVTGGAYEWVVGVEGVI